MPLPVNSDYLSFSVKDDPIKNEGGSTLLEEEIYEVNWDVLTPLLEAAQVEMGTDHVAVSGIRNSNDSTWHYRILSLKFSDKAIQKANGQTRPFYFHQAENDNLANPTQLFVANIPDSDTAYEEILSHIRSVLREEQPNKKSKSTGGSLQGYCVITFTQYVIIMGTIYSYEQTIEADCPVITPDGSGSGEEYGLDVTCDRQVLKSYSCSQGSEEDLSDQDGGGGRGDLDVPDDENRPCVGNPVQNTSIAPQAVSGVGGGRYGHTRSGGEQFHSGIDIANEVDEPFYAMYGGTVVSVGHEPGGIGYYVTIQSYVDGEYYTHQYGHLQSDGRPDENSQIAAGETIGDQGLSGNLEEAVISGSTVPHTHIIVRERVGSGWRLTDDYSDPINPSEIMTTQFDEQGIPVQGTDC